MGVEGTFPVIVKFTDSKESINRIAKKKITDNLGKGEITLKVSEEKPKILRDAAVRVY